jgi:hypothetical protein
MLRRLLESLGGLRFGPGAEPRVMVVVVDNDAERSAEPVVEAVRGAVRWPLAYLVEPERNISLARNRGTRAALEAGADWVAFVDDDEVAHPTWLAELLAAQREFGADAVSGPAVPTYPDGVPGWVVKGRFFEQPRPATGAPVEYPNMFNVLVSARLLRDPGGAPFDAAFARGRAWWRPTRRGWTPGCPKAAAARGGSCAARSASATAACTWSARFRPGSGTPCGAWCGARSTWDGGC